MHTKYTDNIYEKQYLYEEDIKHGIAIKSQVIFTAIFALMTATAYMARFLDFSIKPSIAYVITLLECAIIIILAVSIYFNCKAFSGTVFKKMVYSKQLKNYYESLVDYKREVDEYNSLADECDKLPDVDPIQETEDYISETYADCATFNAYRNDERGRWAFKAQAAFLMACIPLTVASFLFVIFDMDTSSPRKALSIKDTYVGGEISSLKESLSDKPENAVIADLKKRTIILESILSAQKENELSRPPENTTNEKKSIPTPVRPTAPERREFRDDASKFIPKEGK